MNTVTNQTMNNQCSFWIIGVMMMFTFFLFISIILFNINSLPRIAERQANTEGTNRSTISESDHKEVNEKFGKM